MADDTDRRRAGNGQSNVLMLSYWPATSRLPHEVDKVLLAYVILFKRTRATLIVCLFKKSINDNKSLSLNIFSA